MVNKVVLVGNLGKDPETRNLDNGNSVCKFSLATNENYKDKSGEWQTKTEWHEVYAWNSLAQRCAKLQKGNLVYLEGKIKTSKFEKDGRTAYKTSVVANMIRVIQKEQIAETKKDTDIPF